MPNCTRCGGRLEGASTRDSVGGPVPPPWGGDPREPWPPSPPAPGRHAADGPVPPQDDPDRWAEPTIWEPPPRRRSSTPYFLIAGGLVALLTVALAIIFWPSGGSDDPAGPPVTVPSRGEVSESAVSPTAGGLAEQARAVDGLLEEMTATRSELGTAVEEGCDTGALRRVLAQREEQLEKARDLDVSALEDGVAMKEALVRALEASAESNRRYVETSPGCPPDDEVQDFNQRASDAKTEFIRYWTPIAEEQGLTVRGADTI
ncbi:hypothetical protein [Spirillospora albida]|uniref:hypothetical protein n=1 Tax=Spirillospora albida TaxID=58123 RepID=UPI0012FADB6E|nr:hypothetical protein [Spirillospora albida]